MHRTLIHFISTILLITLISHVNGQGINTKFGQNRINPKKTNWEILSYSNVNLFYYQGGEHHAKYAWENYILQHKEVENRLKYSISGDVNIIIYNNLSDYLQGNLEIVNPEFNYAGQTKMINNKMVLYYNGSDFDFTNQIKKEIAKVLVNEMLFGGSLNERLQNSALLELPDWYNIGLAEFIGKGWDTEIDNWAREFFLNENFKKMEDLSYEDRIRAGRSVWYYIKETEGEKAIPDMLFHTKITDNFATSIAFTTGKNLDNFYKTWFAYFKKIYQLEITTKVSVFGTEKIPKKLKKLPNTQFKLSRNGDMAAFVVNDRGKYTIWLHDFNKRQTSKLLSGGHKIVNKGIDYNFPIIDWSNNGNTLGVLVYETGKYILKEYLVSPNGSLKAKNITKGNSQVSQFSYINDFCYSKTNGSYYISGIHLNGLQESSTSDIYLLESDRISQITQDSAIENSLRSTDKNTLLYVSESYGFQKNTIQFPIYEFKSLDISNNTPTVIYTSKGFETIRQPMILSEDYYIILSDKSGIFNSYILPTKKGAKPTKLIALSNYNRNIKFQDISLAGEFGADMLYENGEFHISSYTLADDPMEDTKNIQVKETNFIKEQNLPWTYSPKTKKEEGNTNNIDTILSDSLYYDTKIQTGFKKVDYEIITPRKNIELNKYQFTQSKYKSRFQVDYVITQFDNSILGSYYFPSEIHPEFLTPAIFNGQMKLNISDIVNDYTIDGGFRFNSLFNGGTFFLNGSALKGRIDKKFSFYRRSILIDATEQGQYKRNVSAGGELSLSYPFNENLRLEVAGIIRSDKIIVLSGSQVGGLVDPGINKLYGGLKPKLVYDNTVSSGINNISGQRGNFFIESMQGLNHKSNMLNIGIDLRNYQKVHRNIIFATRAVFNSSFSADKVLYRLGGMENWIEPDMDLDNIDATDYSDYALQSFAGNLRGFSLNQQKGNSYFILNNELRIPIVSYIYRRNISSNFLKNLIVVPFFDLGAAWVGSSPYSLDNPNNTETYNFDIYTIKVRAARNPLLYSTGVGLRAKILGYLIKYDLGIGYKNNEAQGTVHHFSLGVDF